MTAVSGFVQAMLLQIVAGLILTSSLCCIIPLYRVIILKKEKIDYCNVIQMILLLVPFSCLYLGYYGMEAKFQKAKNYEIFSKDSLTYLLAGFLKTFPTLSIIIICIICDEIEKKKNQTVHISSGYKKSSDSRNVV